MGLGGKSPLHPHVSPISSRLHPHLENSRRFGASLGLNLQPPRAPTHSCKRPHNCSHPQNRPVRWEQASLSACPPATPHPHPPTRAGPFPRWGPPHPNPNGPRNERTKTSKLLQTPHSLCGPDAPPKTSQSPHRLPKPPSKARPESHPTSFAPSSSPQLQSRPPRSPLQGRRQGHHAPRGPQHGPFCGPVPPGFGGSPCYSSARPPKEQLLLHPPASDRSPSGCSRCWMDPSPRPRA